MSRPVLAALVALWSPAFASAQADAPAQDRQDPKAAYQELARDFGQAMTAWFEARNEAIRKAQAAGERPPQSVFTPPTKDYVTRAQELAARWAGTDDAVPFLAFVVKSASDERKAVSEAIEALRVGHAKSAAIRDLLGHLGRAGRVDTERVARRLRDAVVEQNPDAGCRAQALLTRGSLRLEGGDADGGAADLRKVAEVTDDEELVDAAQEALFEVENLSVGRTAPEIEGVDVEGVPFKLSDYRGKVVLLDFWGFW